jgi:hypothetical protein
MSGGRINICPAPYPAAGATLALSWAETFQTDGVAVLIMETGCARLQTFLSAADAQRLADIAGQAATALRQQVEAK